MASLKRPRKIIILVQAGLATDKVIDGLLPLLEAGDIIIDGGNAKWDDTIRREKALSERGFRFVDPEYREVKKGLASVHL